MVTTSVAPLFYCGVLPITLESFTASLEGSSVNLNWQISGNINISYFEIEHSTDGVNFYKIGTTDFINDVSKYNFIHQSPDAGKNFYRLKMVDIDGKFSYSNILLVNLNNSTENKLLIYPNPASSYMALQFNADSRQETQISVFDNAGKKLIDKNIIAEKGKNYLTIEDVKNFSDGVYLIRLNIGSQLFIEKFVIRR